MQIKPIENLAFMIDGAPEAMRHAADIRDTSPNCHGQCW